MQKLGALSVLLGICLAGAPLHADTRTGKANKTSLLTWSLGVSGPLQIVLSWTKKSADLDMILVCGTIDPSVAGVDVGVVDRVAIIQVDPLGGCLLGVTAYSGGSAFRVHFRGTTSVSSVPEGRVPTAVPLDDTAAAMRWEAERVLWKLHEEKAAR